MITKHRLNLKHHKMLGKVQLLKCRRLETAEINKLQTSNKKLYCILKQCYTSDINYQYKPAYSVWMKIGINRQQYFPGEGLKHTNIKSKRWQILITKDFYCV